MDSAVQTSWITDTTNHAIADDVRQPDASETDQQSMVGANTSTDINALHNFSAISQQFIESYNHLNDQVQVLRADLAKQTAEKERKALESESLAKKLQVVLATLPNGVVVIDGHGVVQQANSVAVNMLGEPLEGHAWIDIIARAFSPKSDDGHEISLLDGRRVKVDTQAIGTEPGQIVTLTDLTETRRQQENLSREQRLMAIGRMMASLAHQIRTPLSSALLYSGHLISPRLSEDKKQEFHRHMTHSLKQLEHNISDMLLFASGGNAKSQRYGVAELLERIKTDLLDNVYAELDIELDVDFELLKDKSLYGNQQALCGAISNLIENSIQACRDNQSKGRLISISIDIELDQQNNLCIIVTDNGCGLEITDQEQIFEPFHTDKSGGTGLGLAVVKTVVTNYKGQVGVASEPNKGTQFTIRLPLINKTMNIVGTSSETEHVAKG
ncbi:MAG: ATP-binding protein [Gammaproteobacteria bacterium]